MARTNRRMNTNSARTLAVTAGLVLGASAMGQTQILEVHSGTLTTYAAGVTGSQGVKPLHNQRGVNLDGSLRAGPFFGWAVAGNPFEGGGRSRVGHVDLATGSVVVEDLDWAGSALGVSSWPIGRTYNQVQATVNNKTQGRGWFQMSQPEIVLYDADANAGTRGDADAVYLVFGADRYAEFDRTDDDEDTFKGKNGAAGVIQYVAGGGGEPDTYVYYDQHGTRAYFFGGNTSSNRADYQIWKVVDAAGNTAYVGDATTASTAAIGYNTGKQIGKAVDGTPNDGRRYTYAYTSIGGVSRLTEVKVETKTGGTWSSPSGAAEVALITYDYYTGTENDKGDVGFLRMVTVRTTLSDSGSSLSSGIYKETRRYYRYYTRAYDNSDGRRGNAGDLKMIVDPEGCRNFDWGEGGAEVSAVMDDGFMSATDADLKAYSAAYFEYPSLDHRPSKAVFNGECGCTGGPTDTYEFAYSTNAHFSAVSGYDTEWSSRTVVKRSDGTYATHYFDETGQSLSTVITSGDPAVSVTTRWVTQVERDANGCVVSIGTPASNDKYVHSDVVGPPAVDAGTITYQSGAGQITYITRYSSDADLDYPDTDGGLVGFREGVYLAQGTGGTAEYVGHTEYKTAYYEPPASTGGVVRPLIGKTRSYHTSGSSAGTSANYNTTTSSYVRWGASTSDILNLALKSYTTTLPAVDTGNNGKGQTVVAERYLRQDQSTVFVREPYHADESSTDVVVSYTQLDGYGRPNLTIQDKKHESSWTGAGYPSGDTPSTWGLTLSGSGKDIRTMDSVAYDAQSRVVTAVVQDVNGTHTRRTYTSRLADGRDVTVSIPKDASGTYHGPCSYAITNHAGRAVFSGTIVLSGGTSATALSGWIDETDEDPIAALNVGTLFRVWTSIHSEAGTRLDESRAYHLVPGSGVGSSGTNYDATRYGYDTMGRRKRVKDATGTITLTTFDTLGRTASQQLGTNDPDEPSTDNMVTVQELQYDGGSAGGNSRLTRRRAHLDDSGSSYRDTVHAYDYRGRVLLTTNAAAPHVLTKYDNLNRPVAMGQYTVAPSASADPTASSSSNRSALSETLYDEQGRVWKTTRHLIDQSDGSKDDTISSYTWYSDEGRVLKTKGEGGITKTAYDRLGRATNRYVIADDGGESAYADVDDVTGDVVMEEHQTYSQSTTGLALMTATISRYHDDTSTTGALDTDTDLSLLDWTGSKIKGRAQITAMYYDWMGRATDVSQLGTNNATNYDRDGDSPSRSDTELVMSTSYNDNGTALDATDPRALATRTLYDDAGRRIAEIRNYVNGTPSGTTGADDVYTRFTYANGLLTEQWVDLDGDGVKDNPAGEEDDDQVTTYIYGTTKGSLSSGLSKVATGNLLRAIKYPDSTNAGAVYTDIDSDSSDVVSFAYNALGQELRRKDQLTGVLETTYDALGRMTQRSATTLGTGLDGGVRRVVTAYLSRGLVDTVTQYDDPSAGSATDQVQYSYDGWGNLLELEQDVDGVIGAGGRAAFGVEYTYAKRTPTNGAATLARATMVLPGSDVLRTVTYGYGATNSLADDLSRVLTLTIDSVDVAEYEYVGMGQLVRTNLAEPDVETAAYDAGGTPRDYAYLDRFGRVTRSLWVMGALTYHDAALTYDRNSNVLTLDDAVFTRTSGKGFFDAAYTLDDLNRLTNTREGHLSGGAIATGSDRAREELWTLLSQTGNWERRKLDLNGDGDFADTNELDDSGTFNRVNEWTKRDTDSNASDNYTLTWDANGQLTDDDQSSEYVYDAFGRMVEVRNQSHTAVVKYRYNGLGYRILWQWDVDADTVLENDERTYLTYDERWRVVAAFRNSDSTPKERWVHHAAGGRGFGGSSYIDSVLLRDRDANAGTGAADGVLEERRYLGQNHRADVVFVAGSDGDAKEWVRYSSYGVAYSVPKGDYDADGDVDTSDTTELIAMIAGADGWWKDFNVDGSEDSGDYADHITYRTGYSPTTDGTGGRGVLSRNGVGNRIGYAGYQRDPVVSLDHVRHRVLRNDLGRWCTRDPVYHFAPKSSYGYSYTSPIGIVDPSGLCTSIAGTVPINVTPPSLPITVTPLPPTMPASPGLLPHITPGPTIRPTPITPQPPRGLPPGIRPKIIPVEPAPIWAPKPAVTIRTVCEEVFDGIRVCCRETVAGVMLFCTAEAVAPTYVPEPVPPRAPPGTPDDPWGNDCESGLLHVIRVCQQQSPFSLGRCIDGHGQSCEQWAGNIQGHSYCLTSIRYYELVCGSSPVTTMLGEIAGEKLTECETLWISNCFGDQGIMPNTTFD